MNALSQFFARIRPWRRLLQCLVLLAFIAIPVMNTKGILHLYGNFFAFQLGGVPLADPLAATQAVAGGGSLAYPMLIGAGIALLLALVLGRVFCSWVCPYGLISEWVYALRKKMSAPAAIALVGSVVPFSSAMPSSSSPSFFLRPVVLRFGIVVLGLLAVAIFLPFPVLHQLSMPGWYARAWQQYFFYGTILYGALFFPAMLIWEGISHQRFWCRYFCPQSVLLSVFAAVPAGLRVHFTPKQCTCTKNDRACLAACHLALNPRKPALVQRLECTNCGDCVDACRKRGKALGLSFASKAR